MLSFEQLFEKKVQYWTKDIESELEIKGIRINDDLLLNGKIDMVEILDKNFKVNVYDFKTGPVRTRNYIEGKTKDSNGNIKRQLVFYKILLDRYKNGFYKMQSGIIDFVANGKKEHTYKREVFDISKDESEDLLKLNN